MLAETGDGFHIVDEAHRLAALRRLGWTTIPAHVISGASPEQLRFAEIMANVNREDLTKLERAEHLAALKAAWEEMKPSAKNGGDRRSAAVRAVKEAKAAKDDRSPIFGLWSDVADKVGLSRAAFFLAVEISKGLADATKDRIRGTWLEDHQAGLKDLAGQTPEMQAAICDLLFSEPPQAGSVADAKVLAAGRRLPSTADRLYSSATTAWYRMARQTREAFLDDRKADILAQPGRAPEGRAGLPDVGRPGGGLLDP